MYLDKMNPCRIFYLLQIDMPLPGTLHSNVYIIHVTVYVHVHAHTL